jgi:hypothetical protein
MAYVGKGAGGEAGSVRGEGRFDRRNCYTIQLKRLKVGCMKAYPWGIKISRRAWKRRAPGLRT